MTNGERAAANWVLVLALVAVLGLVSLPVNWALLFGSAVSVCALGLALFVGWREARGSVVGAVILTIASLIAYASIELAGYKLPGWQAGPWTVLIAGAVAVVGSWLIVSRSALGLAAKLSVTFASLMSFVFIGIFVSLSIACAHANCF